MSLRRVTEEEIEFEPLDFEGDLDETLEDVIDENGLTLSGEKNEVDDLNDKGRRNLNKNGATLDESSKVLKTLLHSHEDKIRFQAAKFIHERHAGRLEGSKSDGAPKIIFNFLGDGVNSDPTKPSFLNPKPKLIEHNNQDANPV